MRMDARRFAFTAAFLGLAALAACSDSHPRSPGVGTPGVTGTTTTSPSLEGSWVLTAAPLTSSCGTLNTMFQQTTVLTVVQAGNAFSFTMTDNCNNPLNGGTGQIDPTGTVTFGNEGNRVVSSSCTVSLSQDWTGIARTPAGTISGSDIMNLSSMAGANNCNATLPCTVTASFNADRCPATGCQVTCTR
jgi:hypothetical protein